MAARGERKFKLTADREHIVPRFGCGINDFIGNVLHIIKTDFKRVSDDILSVPNQRLCCHLQGATITLIAITHREGSHQLGKWCSYGLRLLRAATADKQQQWQSVQVAFSTPHHRHRTDHICQHQHHPLIKAPRLRAAITWQDMLQALEQALHLLIKCLHYTTNWNIKLPASMTADCRLTMMTMEWLYSGIGGLTASYRQLACLKCASN